MAVRDTPHSATAEAIQTFQKNLADAGADQRGIDGLAYNETADKRSWRAMLDFLGEVMT